MWEDILGTILSIMLIILSMELWRYFKGKGLERRIATYVKLAETVFDGDGRGEEKLEWVIQKVCEKPIFKLIPQDLLKDLINANVVEANKILYGETPKDDSM